jgi:hypothetical protein
MHSTRDNITNDFSVEVNFTGQNLDPARVTEIIGLQPIKSAKTGEPRRNGGAVHEEGIWAYETSSNDEVTECRDHQLNCLIDKVQPRMEELREAGVERTYFYFTLSSFVGLLNIRFKAETLARLGSLNADLYVSCFDCFNPKHSIWQDGAAVAENHAESEG